MTGNIPTWLTELGKTWYEYLMYSIVSLSSGGLGAGQRRCMLQRLLKVLGESKM